jgi:hypothetical protein
VLLFRQPGHPGFCTDYWSLLLPFAVSDTTSDDGGLVSFVQ